IGQHVGAEVRAAEHPELRSIFDLPAEDLDKSIGSLTLPEDELGPNEDEMGALSPTVSGRPRRAQRARGGTLLYASPEQCKHLAGHKDIEALDGRSDLYSLGVMAFRLLTGQYPFARITTAYEAIQNHLEVAPRKVGSLGIKLPRDLAAFVDRCLVKDRARRWRDANEAYEVLARIVHPKLSPLRVGVPIGLVALLGLGGLYWTREPGVHALTLLDPAAAGVSARGLDELYLGPERAARRVRLESEVPWETGAALTLIDATSGAPLPGWTVRWAEDEPDSVEIARASGARTAAAKLEVFGGGGALARPRRWRSERLALRHVGPWRIERATVSGHDGARALDPRGRRLELELGGDPEGRLALASIELWRGDTRVAQADVAAPAERGERALYLGPALDELYTGAVHAAELTLFARDRAGQELRHALVLRLAGPPAGFAPGTGFVAEASATATLLEAAGETLLFSANALRIASDAPARVRLFLGETPALVVERVDPGAPHLVPLAGFGLGGASDQAGVLRLELDDAPFVDRSTPEARTLRLPFRYTPVAPELTAQLFSEGLEYPLVEGRAATNALAVGHEARLVVRTPPTANLVVEVESGGDDGPESPRRLTRSGGAFELPLELAREGAYTLTVRKYVLLAGGEKGPPIPPEQVWRLEIDRSAPRVALTLAGAGDGAEEPLLRAGAPLALAARIDEATLAELSWSLYLPDGSTLGGPLEPASEPALPALEAHQTLEGSYALTLVARDRAGNIGRATRTWQRATRGPALALVEPVASGDERRWVLGSERAFGLRVRATDLNGVAEVGVRLVRGDESGPELLLRRASGDLWELDAAARPTAFPWWTGQALAFELRARDAAGLEELLVERGIVPELPRTGELVLARRSAPAEVMVEIVPSGEYVFGGRPGETARPWNVVIARGALRPYFLDAREVRRGEFLAFVADAVRFRDPRWWPEGSLPGEARAAELAAHLAGEPDAPATGLTQAEAEAYARAQGKRLPTLLEWEFAVRGGEAYRTAPAARVLPGGPADWPANLCAGVLEWSATPERLVADAFDFASQCRLNPELLLAPEPRATSAAAPRPAPAACWVVGAGPGEPPSFTARSLRAGAQGHPDVGFRCALDRESAYRLLDRGDLVLVE
ncbi:MAG TPA: SUMF1/EgtB/PvdO family nonheme iron enzyme, partial [Planctomycetota bacterium]